MFANNPGIIARKMYEIVINKVYALNGNFFCTPLYIDRSTQEKRKKNQRDLWEKTISGI